MEPTFAGLPLPLRITPPRPMTDDELLRFSSEHDCLRFEKEPNGDLVLMTPAGKNTGSRNFDIIVELGKWAAEDGRGIGFESNTGFNLPDGSMRSPDAAWLSLAKERTMPASEDESYVAGCPEFVIELRSQSDSVPELTRKMETWMANGAELAWLIDPYQKLVQIWRRGKPVETLTSISQVAGEGPVAGFVLPLDRIFR